MPNKNIKKRPIRGPRAAQEDAEQSLRLAKAADSRRVTRTKAAREIESTFSKLSSAQLEQLGLDAYYTPLPRPVPARNAIFDPSEMFGIEWEQYERAQEARKASRTAKSSSSTNEDGTQEGNGSTQSKSKIPNPKPLLTLPKRPRWNRDMNKKALESNEAEVFRTWLNQTDEIIGRHSADLLPSVEGSTPPGQGSDPARAKIPSQFERNLSVFAQLWRVSERSDLLCVLLDTRCPLLHLPPSLIDFLRAKAGRRTLLVLTKADLVPRAIAEAWRAWLLEQFGEWTDVVITESYRELGTREGQGSRQMRASFMSTESRNSLIESLQRIHSQLVKPPPRLKSSNSASDASWKPPCVEHVDWDVFNRMDKYAGQALSNSQTAEEEHGEASTEFLTIGLIGQPNVGKSSMLNALLGSKLVRASKTPGKTKAFQTHFLGQAQGLARPPPSANGEGPKARIRLCDSPGLVFPSLVGHELQVLGSILPISQVQAISSSVRFAAAHMPLEEALRLPVNTLPPEPGGTKGNSAKQGSQHKDEDKDEGAGGSVAFEWTAVRILEHIAARYNFRTAKANRWDTNRAGNWVMRALAEGRIPWAFRPPSMEPHPDKAGEEESPALAQSQELTSSSKLDELDIEALLKRGKGIWLGGAIGDDHGESEDEDGDSTEAEGMTDRESMWLSQSLTAASLKTDGDEDLTTRDQPIKINFNRSLGQSTASPSGSATGTGERGGKKKGKRAAVPVVSKRARLREEGLALIAAKAEEVEKQGEEGVGGQKKEEGGTDSEEEDEDEDEWATERSSTLGGSVFLAAGAAPDDDDDDDEEEDD
ncbi:hypothetical protein CF319_g5514 [Tilletia indica]|nr:hypothetical protein CF319_g5514 [Tilletia indica]